MELSLFFKNSQGYIRPRESFLNFVLSSSLTNGEDRFSTPWIESEKDFGYTLGTCLIVNAEYNI